MPLRLTGDASTISFCIYWRSFLMRLNNGIANRNQRSEFRQIAINRRPWLPFDKSHFWTPLFISLPAARWGVSILRHNLEADLMQLVEHRTGLSFIEPAERRLVAQAHEVVIGEPASQRGRRRRIDFDVQCRVSF